MTTVTLAYKESGTWYDRDFDILSMSGVDDVDEVGFIAAQHRYLNGSIDEQIKGFFRVATLDFGVVNDFTDRTFLYNFVRNVERQVRYNGDVLFAALGG